LTVRSNLGWQLLELGSEGSKVLHSRASSLRVRYHEPSKLQGR
jgi:hypothetical protein